MRGPYGNWFPHEEIRGKRLLFVGGGIGMAPLRSLLNFCLDRRSDYGHIDIFYGARTPGDLCYTEEFDAWKQAPDLNLYLAVDKGDDHWTGYVGVIPRYVREVAPKAENAVAITCGPPVMIKFTLPELQQLGFTDEQIITTLENEDEMRGGEVRPVQHRPHLRVPRRPRLHRPPGKGHVPGVLSTKKSDHFT